MTPDDHGHWQRAYAAEQGREVLFRIGNSRCESRLDLQVPSRDAVYCCRGGGLLDKPSAVTRGDWSREWSSQRGDEAHVTTPGVPIIELRRTGGPVVSNELSERHTRVV